MKEFVKYLKEKHLFGKYLSEELNYMVILNDKINQDNIFKQHLEKVTRFYYETLEPNEYIAFAFPWGTVKDANINWLSVANDFNIKWKNKNF